MTWTTIPGSPAGTPNGANKSFSWVRISVMPSTFYGAYSATRYSLPDVNQLNNPLIPVSFKQPIKGELEVDCSSVTHCCVEPPTEYTITAPDSTAYVFEGGDLEVPTANPTLTLERGKTYEFNNVSGAHPFQIQSTSGLGGDPYDEGVTGNGTIGLVTFEVPEDAPAALYYQCTVHSAMGGSFIIVDPDGGGGDGGGGSVRPTSGLVYPRLV